MNDPVIHAETDEWALVVKPHGMPTAPVSDGEEGTLLAWFLNRYPRAAEVSGRKRIECGLVHRLDTATAGLVLIAKTQRAMDYFRVLQERDGMEKRYTAYCAGKPSFIAENPPESYRTLPGRVSSQFRAWGPGRREVRPVFPEDRRYRTDGTEYTTTILSSEEGSIDTRPCSVFECSLTRGFRHQVRAHLCALGHPIIGDTLYNRDFTTGPMHLYATGISFSDPESRVQESFLLPQPDKTIR